MNWKTRMEAPQKAPPNPDGNFIESHIEMTGRHYPIPEWKKKQIIKLRRDARLSQEEIATATRTSISLVSKVLRDNGLKGRLST